jgi:predicted secreted protein
VQIATPADNATFYKGQEMSFRGTATDSDNATLTGDLLVWSSSLDGPIGTGETFTTDALSPGRHTITLTATDARGIAGTDTVSISVSDNSPPIVQIISPLDSAVITKATYINFSAAVTDAEDGTLTGDSLIWTSSIDGPIGTGTSFMRNDLSEGIIHTITLTATDSGGLTRVDSIQIVVTDTPSPTPAVCPAIYLLGDGDPRLETLRQFRDEILSRSTAGKKIIEAYYKNGEKIIAILDKNPAVKKSARKVLEALISVIKRLPAPG